MNPYILNPSQITTVKQAEYEIGLFKNCAHAAQEIAVKAQDRLDSILNVLSQSNPDLMPTVDALVATARDAGATNTNAVERARDLSEFRARIPYVIKLQLPV